MNAHRLQQLFQGIHFTEFQATLEKHSSRNYLAGKGLERLGSLALGHEHDLPFVYVNKLRRLPAKGWAEMIRKVYEVDPMTCPKCGGRMKVVAFLTEYAVVDRIIDHLKLTFVAAKPPPSHVFTEVALPEAEESGAYC